MRKEQFWVIRVAALVAIVATCGSTLAESTAAGRPAFGSWGVDLAAMDRSVKPGDDFYMYVNGLWQKSAQIPPDKTNIGVMTDLQDISLRQARTILEESAADTTAARNSDRQKLGDWYASMMDEARIEALGLAPLKPEFDRIAAITTRKQLEQVLATNNGRLGVAPISVGVGFDSKRVGAMIVSVSIGGMSLPSREFYLDPAYEPIRVLHREHIARALALAGFDNSKERAARVQSLESMIAEILWSRTELRDPVKKFNPTPTSQLSSVAPGIEWKTFLADAGVGAPTRVNVQTPSSTTGIAKLVADVPLENWRDYLDYHALLQATDYLPKAVRDEFFAFYKKTLGDQPEPFPRWKVALLDIARAGGPLQDTLGQEFVHRYVPTDARPQTQAMVDNLMAAFDARLAKLAWMSPETRAQAREKLAKVTIKTIYPDVWQGTVGLVVVRGDAFGNAQRGAAFSRQRELDWLKLPPNRQLFLKPVSEINAYAFPTWNEVVFLAAIVRPPFFDPNADPAVNYGAMGAVIGHEVSHLFDDQGRAYDGDGLLRDWWQPEDAKKFVTATDVLAAQVGSYEPLPGKHVNGRLTLGESIGDLAGLTVAYDAYRRSLGGKEPPVIDGFTGDQRFFIAYAQAWRFKGRDAFVDKLLKIDPHPPTDMRPRTVRNIDAWYKAFDVKPGDALYLPPDKRIQPW